MGKQLALMQLREARIAALVKRIREHSKGFQRPPLVVIGGYALRKPVTLPGFE